MAAVPVVQNLIPFSEDLTNAAWSKVGAVVSVGATTSPDGVLRDGILAADTTNTIHMVSQAEPFIALGKYATFGVVLKAGAVSWCRLLIDGTFVGQSFGLSGDGIVGVPDVQGTGVLVDAKIVHLGGGWYFMWIVTIRMHPSSTARVYAANADGTVGAASYAAADIVTPQLYFWRGQFIEANWAGPYIKTLASPINTGRIRDVLPTQQNYFRRSQELNNGAVWSNNNMTVTPNVLAAPDGTLTADSITGITNGTNHHDSQATAMLKPYGVYTLSLSVQRSSAAGAWNWIAIGPNGSATMVYLDLVNKVAGLISQPQFVLDYSVTDDRRGNGWMTVKVTFIQDPAAGTTIFFFISPANAVIVQNPSGVVDQFWWDARLVDGMPPGTLTLTAGSVINTGRTRDAVLMAQNLIVRSDELDNASWTKSNVTITANQETHPLLATLIADLFSDTVDGAPQTHIVTQALTGLIIGAVYTCSAIVKDNGTTWVGFFANLSSTNQAFFNIAAGTLGSRNNALAHAIRAIPGYTGWYQISMTFVYNGGTYGLLSCNADNGSSYQGAGTRKFYSCAHQLAAANWPGPNAPTAGAVTITKGRIRDKR